MIIDETKMYYCAKEAAHLLHIDYEKLRSWIKDGYIPQRLFTSMYVVSGTDFEAIIQLANMDELPTPQYAADEPEIVGYSLRGLSDVTGISMRRVEGMVKRGVIQSTQTICGIPLYTAQDAETLRTMPNPGRMRKDVKDMTQHVEYKDGVPPLSERELDVLKLYANGNGLSVREIGKQWGISGSAVHALVKRAMLKQELLASGKPLAEFAPKQAKSQQLSVTDTEIMRRVLDGKSNAEIATELSKSSLTEGKVQRRMRKWAETAERETGTPHDRIMTAAYVLAKFGVLHDTTAA